MFEEVARRWRIKLTYCHMSLHTHFSGHKKEAADY
nr:MAG TPA: hypothetical protein [Caudoviricetes sp.]